MGKFAKGVFTGVAVTVGAVAAVATAIKKTVVDPIDEKEKFVEENRKKAARKRVSR
ncbi:MULTISPECIES: DUF3042 family protein [unclassified Enterococcus]|uniref:DUF3042 family protein n=1 Tax=unclassified Enterococcus TaxID=2608891 RepID=UPI0015522E41|nr:MULTISPECIES: DUF3042 family protein [unclassified Enterococcus]MBS7577542.1 DUF3042 family protein [Enterococcus sp. MMGLQ5-2]MBS7584959.1 DUF3042 family protein [Enterococcus sp. MMGLQ5-1]NPD12814.1 DUF3042 family protein [Enterococcus sp. MMGLQ5-1]NPD37375.1 DUF3042 family protein [Enterococcus sp. MMGLQ5-2]